MIRLLLCAGLCVASVAATAQWQWLDKDGRKVYSDQGPPSDVPANKILKQPGGARSATTPVAVPATSPANGSPATARAGAPTAPASAAKAAAPAPKLSGKDADLEAKIKQAEEEEAAKKKAADEKLAKDQAQNCERARRAKAAIDSGVRIQQTNAKGELEYLSDTGRATEGKRLQDVITADCK